MKPEERAALAALRFDLAPTPDDVWRPSPFHVDELHRDVVRKILAEIESARYRDQANPAGVVMQGLSGSGKTHLLGMVRERILHQNIGYFFLVGLLNGKEFWPSAALCIVEELLRDAGSWSTQLKAFLRRLTPALGLTTKVRDAVCGDALLTKDHLDSFIYGLREYNRAVGQMAQDTARALVLFGASDQSLQDIGFSYLTSIGEVDSSDRSAWGIGPSVKPPMLIVRDISRLLALTGPTVIAVDQIDTLFADSLGGLLNVEDLTVDQRTLVGLVADGLMTLREQTRRTLIVVSCLPDVWQLIGAVAIPVKQRFRKTSYLARIPSADVARQIVAKRLGLGYREVNFKPPYDTWPVKHVAFRYASNFLVRNLLQCVQDHVASCLESDIVTELEELREVDEPPKRLPPQLPPDDLAALDRRFAELVAEADVAAALDPKREDAEMPSLLAAGLAAWIDEQGERSKDYKHDPLPSAKPALHARLRRVMNGAIEDEVHWSIRAVATKHATSVIAKVKAATTMSGLSPGVSKRHVALLRNSGWELGPKTIQAVNQFRHDGGVTRQISIDDLKTFAALREMRANPHPAFRAWLIARTPATNSDLFRDLLGSERTVSHERAEETPGVALEPGDQVPSAGRPMLARPEPLRRTSPDDRTVEIGYALDGAGPLVLRLESLRKHVAIFAGSGSGKTVLIRRLVEECALRGVSAIVLDPNNDLARLGDPWPEPPKGWDSGDAARAAEYLDSTDIVVWTPRRETGRPLSFQPLPDLASVRNDPDEFAAAVDAAVAALAPRARLEGATTKAELGQAVLREALLYYSSTSARGLHSFIDILADLPEGVSALSRGERIAADLAETLRAATVNDPLFGGSSVAADPGVLLTPPPGKRSRISVISFIGLHSEAQRQGFVNQLQMALFAWIKQNPAGDRPLGGLFVMDEAQTLAPAGGMTACTASSIALASQARKYGLGLVFATQAPRALHNRITGNAATQFYGLLGHPTQIQAAKDLARAKGGNIPDIGVLGPGQFYAAPDGGAFEKVRIPLCLSYHPSSPLSPEEVLERARRR